MRMSRCLGFLRANPRVCIFIEKTLTYFFFKANVSGFLINAYKVHSEYAVCYVRSQGLYFLKTNDKSGDALKVVA